MIIQSKMSQLFKIAKKINNHQIHSSTRLNESQFDIKSIQNINNSIRQNIFNSQYRTKSFTFHKQVLSCVMNPNLINSQAISEDARRKASQYLNQIISVGVYTCPSGFTFVRQNIVKYISQQNQIEQPNVNNLFLIEGIAQSIHMILKCMIVSQIDTIMIPVPEYKMFSKITQLFGGSTCPYFLNQQLNWQVQQEQLERCLIQSRKQGKNIKSIVIVNPGNPTGSILSIQTLQMIIRFAIKNRLVIISDEANQDFIYNKQKPFVPVIRALYSLGKQYIEECELIYMYSLSKSPFGQIGLKCAYIHCHNIMPQIMTQFLKVRCLHSSVSIGQILLDLTITSPINNVCLSTKNKYIQQKQALFKYMQKRVKLVGKYLSEMKNVKLSEINGGNFGYVRVYFSNNAIQQAGELSVDEFYCNEVYKHINMRLIPGVVFGQQKNTYHFRMNILNFNLDELVKKLQGLKIYNNWFHQKYRD